MVAKEMLFRLLFFLIFRTSYSEFLQTQILEARQLYPFRAYKDVQIFHYIVPTQVSLATWQYKANGSFHCSPKAVAVYLQYGSYPVMSPWNLSFPDYFVLRRLYLHKITLYTDLVPVTLNITNPLPGNWYAAAFLLDNTERIAQKGLYTPCSGWLTSSVKFSISSNVITILPQSQISQEISDSKMYRFFASSNSWSSEIELHGCEHNSSEKCPLVITARPLAFPLLKSGTDTTIINCTFLDECNLQFVPVVSDWNYISVQSLVSDVVRINFTLTTEACKKQQFDNSPIINNETNAQVFQEMEYMNITGNKEMMYSENSTCWPDVPLIRISLPTNLAFEYNLPPDEDDAYPLILNITNNSPTLTGFEVLPMIDIGGTLVIELAVSPFMNLSVSNVSVTGCLTYGVRPVSSEGNSCNSGIILSVNTSSWDNRLATVLVPFPEAGTWYFSLLPNCFISESGENSSSIVPCESKVTPVFLRIRSAPCILGQCGSYGTCYQYVSGGFIFSTCNCIAGWQGWGCTDNSTAESDTELLLDVLLLTLSNLLFVPAIIMGIKRKYYTEAFVYFSTMVFSTFYHACDAEVYSYCLIRLSVLQFCDFYSAILSIWVTLIAMANLPNAAQSFTHMAGAVGVALGVEYDRTGLWVFVLPAGIGLLILIISWTTRCYQKHICYPKKKTWLICILPGIILAVSGLILYAFLETKDNYPYVHSAWHGTIALSVLFLLPKRQDSKGTTEPTSTSSYIRVGELGDNIVVQNCSAYEHLLTPTP